MLGRSPYLLAKRFRYNTKYPALVSYNKLPWQILNYETPEFHMHVAPHYEQILTLAASTAIPHFVMQKHLEIPTEHRLRLLPGMLYTMMGNVNNNNNIPVGFKSQRVLDPTSLQYYGRLNSTIARVNSIQMLISDDLRLICNSITFEQPLRLQVAPHAALGLLLNNNNNNNNNNNSNEINNSFFTLYHFVRPNRPPSELQLEKYYIHNPQANVLNEFSASSKIKWEPRLQSPKRNKEISPLPKYKPPQSYLMGLAERLAVIPGNSFGRRSLMWGHWF